jgi:hypothetical protein
VADNFKDFDLAQEEAEEKAIKVKLGGEEYTFPMLYQQELFLHKCVGWMRLVQFQHKLYLNG